jgi:hypothetical protein
MAIKLHRCATQWVKIKGHPCWKVEKALQDAGIEYERVPGPRPKDEREMLLAGTGQKLYPAIQFEDGTWYKEQSKDMAARIRAGNLGTTAQSSG